MVINTKENITHENETRLVLEPLTRIAKSVIKLKKVFEALDFSVRKIKEKSKITTKAKTFGLNREPVTLRILVLLALHTKSKYFGWKN